MVDSILTNQAPIVQRTVENRSITTSAVSNASTVPEMDLADDIIDVSPRTMDTNSDQSFSARGAPDLQPPIRNLIDSGGELRPSLENFRPVEITSERMLENRIADIELRSNNEVDETDSMVSVNNSAIEAFTNVDVEIQQSVDISA